MLQLIIHIWGIQLGLESWQPEELIRAAMNRGAKVLNFDEPCSTLIFAERPGHI